MNEEIWKIPYSLVKNDWGLLQKYLDFKGNPKYIIVGNVNLYDRQDISDLGNLVGVEGGLNLGWSSIESLGELEFVGGDFSLWGCKNIKTLGKLKKVGGHLYMNMSSIESLGKLEEVTKDFDLCDCQNIKTLGKLKKVGGALALSRSSIESLGELEFVGEDLFINGTKFTPSEFKKVNVVGRIIR